MHGNLQRNIEEARETEREILHGAAKICSCPFGIAWKALHPFKAAEELAARVGCSVRTAGYELSGEHDPSAQSLLALMEIVTPRRKRG